MRRFAFIVLIVLIGVSGGFAQRRKSSRAHVQKHSRLAPVTAEPVADTLRPDELRLTLLDGSVTILVRARESEQGIWYERSGVTHLIQRDRIKSIDRPQRAQPVAPDDPQVTMPSVAQTASANRPVWIHLTGGARVEADNVTESASGVWYTRGSLAIFVERSRIERIEREDPERVSASDNVAKERGWTTGNSIIDSLIKQNGAKHGVDPYLIFCVMEQESHFSTRAVSPKGARGLMQLMPGTSARFGVRHPHNPAENIAAGARYLKQLINQFNGRVDLVLASYNAGEGTVIRYGHKVPPYRETRDYVRKISYRYHRAKTPSARAGSPVVPPASPAL